MSSALENFEEHDMVDTQKTVKKGGLGRGLNALFGDEEDTSAEGQNSGNRRMMPIEWLSPNPNQPRRHFAPEALEELAGSIKQHGIIQPILVRPVPEAGNKYEIVAGERRWRASQMAQLHEVPVTIQYLTDESVLELGLIENLQRQDLGALEEAEAFQQLMDRFGHTQEKVAQAVGKSRSYVANMVRLLVLPESVKGYLRDGKLSAGHARTLITAQDPEALALAIVEGDLSVRDAEALTGNVKAKGAAKALKKKVQKGPNTRALEQEISNILGMKVTITPKGNKGQLVINYTNFDQLDDVIKRLSQTPNRIGGR